MTFKHMLLSSAVAGSFLLPATLTNPAVFPLTAEAQAAINVSINIGIGTFYDRLSPYGNWVFYHDRYVWLPGHVSVRWQPYTEGHWVYTRRYGWLWVSDERFGWATYHYGRWGYARDIGWYWVPGRRWAPAWVVWCHGDDDIAWAPLPPDYDNDLNITISFGDIPDYYWQAVPASAFLSFDLSGRVTRDRDHVRSVIQGGNQQTVHIENNIVVNNVIDTGFVEKHTKTKVVVLQEKSVDNPDAASKSDSNSVAIFNPDVKEETSAKPAKIRKFEEIVKERTAKGIPQLEQPANQTAAPVVGTDANTQPADQNNLTANEAGKTKKKKLPAAFDTQQPGAGNVTTEVPVKKLKMEKTVNTVAPKDVQQNVDQQNANQQNVGEQFGKKKKKNAGSSDQQGSEKILTAPADVQTAPPGQGKKKKKFEQPANTDANGKPVCDPAVEACPPPAPQ